MITHFWESDDMIQPAAAVPQHRVAIAPVEFAELNGLSAMETEAILAICRHANSKDGLTELRNAIYYLKKLIELYYSSEAAAADEQIDVA